MDEGIQVRLVKGPVPPEKELGDVPPVGGRHLIQAVPVQVRHGHVPQGPKEQGGRAIVGEGIIVVDLAKGLLGKLAVVGDSQAGLAEEVREGLRAVLRRPPGGIRPGDSQKAVPFRGGDHHGGMEITTGRTVDFYVKAVVPVLIGFKACGVQHLRHAAAALHPELRRPVGLHTVQGNDPLRVPGRVGRGNDGRIFTPAPVPVAEEAAAAVCLRLQGHAGGTGRNYIHLAVSAAEPGKTAALVVQEDLAILPFSGSEGDFAGIVRVAMEVIVGVVFLQIGEPVQAPLVRLIKRQAQVLLQNRVHLRGRTFHKVHHGVLAAPGRLRHGPALLLRHLHGLSRTVVEEFEEVDLLVILRGLHRLEQELVHHVEAVAVEDFGIEPPPPSGVRPPASPGSRIW